MNLNNILYKLVLPNKTGTVKNFKIKYVAAVVNVLY